ncbi:IS66 family transposase [Aquabacterium sp.]|uniref:IS66 family transposase n=1 Tax=Aquabacterium sp. TaxID=1872578 RepID=UPI003BAFCDA4
MAQAPLVHMDETRYPREGLGANWVWAAVQPALAVFSVLPSRARYVIHDLIGVEPQGIVVSDRYAAYAYIDARCAGRIGTKLLGMGYLLFRWRDQGKTCTEFEPLQRRVRLALSRGGRACRMQTNPGHLPKPAQAMASLVDLRGQPHRATDQQ